MKELCENDNVVESVTALSLWVWSGFAGKKNAVITHRVVLSIESSILDPLRLVSPFTIRVRLILHLIWQKALKSWDEQIPEDINEAKLSSGCPKFLL